MASFNRGLFKTLAAGGLMSVIAGCASMEGNNYSCSGMPDGDSLACMSTRDVYAATNDDSSLAPQAVASANSVARGQASPTDVRATPREHYTGREAAIDQRTGSSLPATRGVDPMDVPANFVAPRLPDHPVPVRTPAQVMRVWVAPWESDQGDLMTVGYLYTEIEPRRWVLGEPQGAQTNRSFAPLQ